MNPADILALYDQEMRLEVEWTDSRREVAPTVVRHVNLHNPGGAILYAWLTPENQAATVQEQIAYFEQVGGEFEWKVHSHDTPLKLQNYLATCGFEVEEAEALMILDVAQARPNLRQPIRHTIRRLTQPAQLADVAAVQQKVWNESFDWLLERLAQDLQHHPDHLSVYVGYVAEQPVSSAWTYFHPGSHFAGLWGGSTLAAFRGQGFYTALLAARLQEAHQRGVRYLTVDASPMSRPILEKLGFTWVSTIYPYKWRPSSDDDRVAR
jgi:GNAT superfamily N-acetyltransferase